MQQDGSTEDNWNSWIDHSRQLIRTISQEICVHGDNIQWLRSTTFSRCLKRNGTEAQGETKQNTGFDFAEYHISKVHTIVRYGRVQETEAGFDPNVNPAGIYIV